MNDEKQTGRRRSRLVAKAAGGAVVALVLVASIPAILRSPRFHRWVQARVVASLENMTGGRVEIARLDWNLRQLRLELDGLTIHGREAPGQAPYVHADRLVVEGKILSLARRRLGLHSITIDRPVIHLIIDSEGHTNQPEPKALQQNPQERLRQVFDLAIDHAQVSRGELMINGRRTAVELSAQGVRAQLAFQRDLRQYSGSLQADNFAARYKDYRPLASSVAVEFSLSPNLVVLHSLTWASGPSRLEASGNISNFQDPRITLEYRGSLNLRDLGAIARLPQIRQGVLQLNGSAAYSAAGFSAAGKALLKNGEWYEESLQLPSLNGGAEYSVKNGDVSLPHIFGTAYGGTVTGSAEIKNWANVPPPGRPAPPATWEQRGAVHLRVQNMSVPALVSAISSQVRPLNRLNLVGAASGTMDSRWTGSPARAVSDFQLDLAAPPHPALPSARAAGKPGPPLPFSGRLHITHSVATRQVELSQVDLHVGSLALKLDGAFGLTASNLRLSLAADDVHDVTALLDLFVPPDWIPPGLSGKVAFTGTVSGSFANTAVAGHLQASDVTVPLPLPGVRQHGGTPVSRTAHLDQFAADVRYSPQAVAFSNGSARSGGQSATFQVSAGLLDGKLADVSPIAVTLSLRAGLLDHLQALAGYSYPISGTLDSSLRLAGTKGDPAGSATIHITGAQAFGEPISFADAELRLEKHQVQAEKLALGRGQARVTGSAGYDLRAGSFRFDVRGGSFELAQIPQLQTQRTSVSGLLSFTASGSGTADRPAINADLGIEALALSGERLGNMKAQLVTAGDTLRLTGRSSFPASELTLDGSILLRGDLPGSLELHLARLDVDALLHQFLRGRLTGHSSLTGVVTAQGPFRHPGRLSLRVEAEQFSADIEQMRLRNQGPVRLAVANGALRVEQLRMQGPETEFTASGSLQLARRPELDLRADGHVNLALLQTFNPDIHSSGQLNFGLNLRGLLSRPDVRGQVQITDGAISFIDLPNALSHVNGVVVFNQDRMQVQSLSAQTGGGAVTIGGFVDYANGLSAGGLLFNITAQGRDMRLRYPQGVSSAVTADLRLTGSPASALLSGNITILKVNMNPQFDFAVYLAQAKKLQAPPNPNSLLSKVRLDVRLVSTPGLDVQTSLAKLSGDLDLRLRGTADHPTILGRINITDGRVAFNGTTYEVERGDISFSNPVRIEPVFDVELSSRVRDYDIGLGFHGPLDRLSTTYRSEPPLPTSDIINLLAFGRTPEEAATVIQPSPSFTESASNAILSQALNATVSDRVQKLFGVSHFKISPDLGGPEVNPNAQVTIEQQVSKNITLTYITNLSQSQQQIIQMEYNINRNLSIVALRDQNGVVSFDVRIRRRRR